MCCLAHATPWPVLVGFTVYDSFMSDQVAESGVMPVPKVGEQQQGGHEAPVSATTSRNGWRLIPIVGAMIGGSADTSGCRLR